MLRGHRRPDKKWTGAARLLLIALQVYEDDLCPGCGTPRTYGMDDDAAGLLNTNHGYCHGCRALEKEQRDRGDKPPPPGQKTWVTPNEALQHAMTHPLHVPPAHS